MNPLCNFDQNILKNLLLLKVIILFHFIKTAYSTEGFTPIVTIHEEVPASYSGRVRTVGVSGTREISVLMGEKVVMECSIFHLQDNSQVSWMFLAAKGFNNQTPEWTPIGNGLHSQDFSKWKVSTGKRENSFRLEIFAVTYNDEGIYECSCFYTPSAPKEVDQRIIKVKESPRVVTYLSTYNLIHNIGERAQLVCTILGFPKPVVTWQRIGGMSPFIRGKGKYAVGENLIINSVAAEDTGDYICRGENDVGKVFYRVRLEVKHKPLFRLYPIKNLARQRVNCHLELLCIVSAYPSLYRNSIKWVSSKRGTLEPGMDRYKVRLLEAAYGSYFLSLSLEPVLDEDFSDQFTCMAANEEGDNTDTITITESEKAFPSRTGQIICGGCKFSIFSSPTSFLLLQLVVRCLL